MLAAENYDIPQGIVLCNENGSTADKITLLSDLYDHVSGKEAAKDDMILYTRLSDSAAVKIFKRIFTKRSEAGRG